MSGKVADQTMPCPICKKSVTRADDPVAPNRFFPFCSDRCKLVDLGRWLSGKYQITTPAVDDDDASDPSLERQDESTADE